MKISNVEVEYVAEFPANTTAVTVRHPDHRTVKVQVGGEGVCIRSVGGYTHFRPSNTDGD